VVEKELERGRNVYKLILRVTIKVTLKHSWGGLMPKENLVARGYEKVPLAPVGEGD
jgi:hypothetical protein